MGVDIISFSGDKLIGGPQSGIICGKKKFINKIFSNSMYRALRCDKVIISMLESILRTYRHYNKVENTNLFTNCFESNSLIRMPVAHNEGRYYVTDETLQDLERNKQIILRYVDSSGEVSINSNPNGSVSNIAAVSNTEGNVLGMMPHPERASENILSPYSTNDGLGIFRSMALSLEVMLQK